jgi:hypothetical protein
MIPSAVERKGRPRSQLKVLLVGAFDAWYEDAVWGIGRSNIQYDVEKMRKRFKVDDFVVIMGSVVVVLIWSRKQKEGETRGRVDFDAIIIRSWPLATWCDPSTLNPPFLVHLKNPPARRCTLPPNQRSEKMDRNAIRPGSCWPMLMIRGSSPDMETTFLTSIVMSRDLARAYDGDLSESDSTSVVL